VNGAADEHLVAVCVAPDGPFPPAAGGYRSRFASAHP
jgi:hypothetical protein